jgi:proline dehydrogenase
MLRVLLLYLSQAEWAKRLVTHWGLARRIALRFVAGETQAAAVEAIRALNAGGISATVDILGESVADESETRRAANAYCDLVDAIDAHRLDAWVSVKLTALGLDIDAALCRQHMRRILAHAGERGLVVTIDMEDHHYTQRTLDLFHALRDEDGFQNVRAVIQSYLYRSDADIAALTAGGAGVRLCKGAYKEPLDIAYPSKRDVDAAYLRQTRALLDAAGDGRGYPGIATHDEQLIQAARDYVTRQAIPRDRFEFQMLYGVRGALQKQLAAEGCRVRVYVPFGTQWYPYFMRRLAERPANLWFFVSNFFRR